MGTVSGYYISVTTTGEKCKVFVPNPLPSLSDLNITFELSEKLDQALLAFKSSIKKQRFRTPHFRRKALRKKSK